MKGGDAVCGRSDSSACVWRHHLINNDAVTRLLSYVTVARIGNRRKMEGLQLARAGHDFCETFFKPYSCEWSA
jgi:hypothetical protein